MEIYDSWVVAAAILAIGEDYESELHYRTLAQRVVDTGLTMLGRKGDTPAQTLGVVIRSHRDIFTSGKYRGYYRLVDREEILKRPQINNAIAAIRNARCKSGNENEIESLRREKEELAKGNALLERKIAEIAEICSPFIDD